MIANRKGFATVFGEEALVYVPMLDQLIPQVLGVEYQFMPIQVYKSKLQTNVAADPKQYWTEILYRCHLAAASTIIRMVRWLQAADHGLLQPNLLCFAAGMRGFLEASADSVYTLKPLPMELANNCALIDRALAAGESPQHLVHKELEDLLIHYSHAGYIADGKPPEPSWNTKSARKYISSFGKELKDPVYDLYRQLCGIVHPAAPSVYRYVEFTSKTSFATSLRTDRAAILELCVQNRKLFSFILMSVMNGSLLTFRALNEFDIGRLHSELPNDEDFASVPGWSKIINTFNASRRE